MADRLSEYRAFMASQDKDGIQPRYEAQFPNATPAWFAGWYAGMLAEAVALLDAAERAPINVCAVCGRRLEAPRAD